jgi:di/tricarboxylate transporter
MVLLGCLTPEEAYRAIDWRVLFLIAGMLALGVAMEKTGAARLLADGLLSQVEWMGPIAILSVLYLLTSLLTEVLSNNAAIVLLAPIAIATAESAGVGARPFLIAVMFAASSSFMTPIGYQTNTMIYGPGRYRFRDFMRVGAPLNLMFWLLATLLIPYLWPFE